MKKEFDASKAGFKLDVIETANADPRVSASDLKLLAAYVSVMDWPSCRTWLATSLALAKTGLSERQFRSSRSNLQGKGKNKGGNVYLRPARRSGDVSAYTLVNPWRDEAMAHVEAMTAYHKETERQKKAAQRANLSRQNLQGQNDGCPGKICRSVPAEIAAYYPSHSTPKKEGSRGQEDRSAEVVNLADHLKRSA